MHELGVVLEVVKTVENFARENAVSEVETVTLQIGELSSMIPKYIEECWPCAVDGTTLEQTKLAIEIIQANARCPECGKVYAFLAHREACPDCGCARREILNGQEFMIKNIVAR